MCFTHQFDMCFFVDLCSAVLWLCYAQGTISLFFLPIASDNSLMLSLFLIGVVERIPKLSPKRGDIFARVPIFKDGASFLGTEHWSAEKDNRLRIILNHKKKYIK